MRPPPSLQTLRILWFALLTSNVLYVAVLLFLRANRQGPAPVPDPMLAPAFALAALGLAATSVLLPPRLYASAAAATTVATREDIKDDPMGAQQGFRRPAASERIFADASLARSAALGAYMSPFIVGMALAEAVSLLGFVLGFLGGAAVVFLPFFVVGVALQASRFPALPTVERAFEAAQGARFAGDA